MSSKFTGYSFVTFERHEDALHVYKKLHNGIFYRIMRRILPSLAKKIYPKNVLNDNLIQVTFAPDPYDILWCNLGFSFKKKHFIRLFTHSTCLGLAIISNIVIYKLTEKQFKIVSPNQKVEKDISAKAISLLFSLCIYSINYVSTKIIEFSASTERRTVYTRIQNTITFKIAFYNVLNFIVVPVYVYLLLKKHIENEGDCKHAFARNIVFVAVFDAFFPLLNIVNPRFWYRVLKRKYYEKLNLQKTSIT